ncbi:unnamed protein product [Nezara viridula]|uniref:Uncharacterized protein n=1 Tax=Nezara viridula TaxID=85310 RepID=A0A9P0HQJ6_NEZVI|nr:unnamed protein product [Nezara viridula]
MLNYVSRIRTTQLIYPSPFMMKLLIFAFIITYLAVDALYHRNTSWCQTCELTEVEPCPYYLIYDPRCGKQEIKGGKWLYTVFSSQCEMDNANLRGGGWKPCCWFKGMPSKSEVFYPLKEK